MILFGHQTGNPNAHHAALALEEAGMLGAYCTPGIRSCGKLNFLKKSPESGNWRTAFRGAGLNLWMLCPKFRVDQGSLAG